MEFDRLMGRLPFRSVSGILRGFDPFMNIVVEDAVEHLKVGLSLFSPSIGLSRKEVVTVSERRVASNRHGGDPWKLNRHRRAEGEDRVDE